jgi:hypothetical protein
MNTQTVMVWGILVGIVAHARNPLVLQRILASLRRT